MRAVSSRVALLSAAFLAVGSLAALAETLDCQRIRRVPATITSPGVYCLARDLGFAGTTGAAIRIDSDDVVLDLNGRTLDGSAAGPATEAVGVGSTGHANLVVKNGTIRGFNAGVQVTTAATATVEGIRAVGNTASGIAADGTGLQVRGNQVVGTGGSTIPGSRALAIAARGPGGIVADNDVVDTEAVAGSFAYGIHATGADGMVIEGNRITNRATPPGVLFGILIPFSKNVVVSNNRVTNATYGVAFSSFATGVYRDNLTAGVSDPYPVFDGAGVDAGNNQ
jgi:nitrous oxidase accessory protein NosD